MLAAAKGICLLIGQIGITSKLGVPLKIHNQHLVVDKVHSCLAYREAVIV